MARTAIDGPMVEPEYRLGPTTSRSCNRWRRSSARSGEVERRAEARRACDEGVKEPATVIASVAKQSIFPYAEAWIASLRSQ